MKNKRQCSISCLHCLDRWRFLKRILPNSAVIWAHWVRVTWSSDDNVNGMRSIFTIFRRHYFCRRSPLTYPKCPKILLFSLMSLQMTNPWVALKWLSVPMLCQRQRRISGMLNLVTFRSISSQHIIYLLCESYLFFIFYLIYLFFTELCALVKMELVIRAPSFIAWFLTLCVKVATLRITMEPVCTYQYCYRNEFYFISPYINQAENQFTAPSFLTRTSD